MVRMNHRFMDVSPQVLSPSFAPVRLVGNAGKLLDAHVMLCRRCWEVQLHALDHGGKIQIVTVNPGYPSEACEEEAEA